ncbi:hypothetical protein H920_08166 [Fukomys damarensis]|uniref:Uncharacterized protein n=1 Tax=Fukomys damarensis TaxID=885580 RepID=A0A091DJK6_FUKDA|nr:hypothetical protein H920_08166 [Fukomys damarensis]
MIAFFHVREELQSQQRTTSAKHEDGNRSLPAQGSLDVQTPVSQPKSHPKAPWLCIPNDALIKKAGNKRPIGIQKHSAGIQKAIILSTGIGTVVSSGEKTSPKIVDN